MTAVVAAAKPLAVNPLQTGQSVGAALAILGLEASMPLEHGSRGCTSFAKLFLMRHFQEPIALQTTAMELLTTVLGADGSIVEALATVCARNRPAVIGLISTSLSETQGADVPLSIAAFREQHPEHAGVAIVPVRASDTAGCLERGYARAVAETIRALVPEAADGPVDRRRVDVLAPAMLTPGDIDALRDWIGAFGLEAAILPDLGGALDGHLAPAGYATVSRGGTPLPAIAGLGRGLATIAIGPSLDEAADLLHARTGTPVLRFPALHGLEASDAFTAALSRLSGRPVPAGLERARARLLDAMVDAHFHLGGARLAIAADPDLLAALARLVAGLGCEVAAAVASAPAAHLRDLPLAQVAVGDLEDLEAAAAAGGAELLLANSHGARIARRLDIAHLRAGYPLSDALGAYARPWIGYAGARQAAFDLANLLAGQHQAVRPYRSRYWRGTPRDAEVQHA